MPDDDDTQDDDTQDDDNTQNDDESTDDGTQAIADASPDEVEAHRGLLGEALSVLQSRGVDTSTLADEAGALTDDVSQMSHGDLVNTTLALAQQHPELLQQVADRYPAAQGILGSVLQSG